MYSIIVRSFSPVIYRTPQSKHSIRNISLINSSKTKLFANKSRNFELPSEISKKSYYNNTCVRHNNKSKIDLISLRRAIIGEEKKSNSKGEMNYQNCKKLNKIRFFYL